MYLSPVFLNCQASGDVGVLLQKQGVHWTGKVVQISTFSGGAFWNSQNSGDADVHSRNRSSSSRKLNIRQRNRFFRFKGILYEHKKGSINPKK